MINFSNTPYTHKVRAYSTQKAVCFISQGDTTYNLDAPLLSYPQNGFYVFDLSSFFRFFSMLKIQKPEITKEVSYLGEAQNFTVKTFVQGNEVHSSELAFFPGTGLNGVDTWFNKFLTFQPYNYEVGLFDKLFRYVYLNNSFVDIFQVSGYIEYEDGSTSQIVGQQQNYQHGLHLIDCSLSRYKSQAVANKVITRYSLFLADTSNKPISPTLSFKLHTRPNHYPVPILYRNRLGVWDTFTFARTKDIIDVNTLKGIFEGNNEVPTYIENRDKISVTTRAVKDSLLLAIAVDISQSPETYIWNNASQERVFLSQTSVGKFTTENAIVSLQLEFQKAQVNEVYV